MAATIGSHISDFVLGQDDSKAEDIAKVYMLLGLPTAVERINRTKNSLIADLYEKNITLIQVVESMGEYLLSPAVEQRKRGTQLMVYILQKLPSDFLSQKEVGHITAFLLSKLGDHHSVQPFALHGLAVVTSFSAFHDGEACRQICSDIFKEIQNQSLSQADRRATYTIFLNLLTIHLADIQALEDTFVCGYIQQMDGEKDPRNLMLAFRCSRLICQNFRLGPMEEEMFEVNSCYFPVDFVPPPNDPHGVTRNDLSEALCGVMAATPVFAPYCFPLLIEKITSDVASAKMDALKTLCACIPVYETKHLLEYLGSLAAPIMREVRAGVTDDIVAASLQALTAIVSQVSQVLQQLDDFMAETGSNLVRQVESDNPTARLSSTRMLCAMAKANAQVCYTVASRLVPVVCSISPKLTQLEQHTAFFIEIISLLQQVADSQKSKTALDWSILQDYRCKLQELCDKLLASKDGQLQAQGMRGLCALVAWGAVLSGEEICTTLNKMTTRALMADIDEIKEESARALGQAVREHPQLADGVISQFKQVLQNNLASYATPESRQMFDNSATLLAAIAVDRVTGEKICQVFVRLLQSFTLGHENCMAPVSCSIAKVLASGHLSSQFLVTTGVPAILEFLWPGCASWQAAKKQLHVTMLSSLVNGLRSLVLLPNSQASQQIAGLICNKVMKECSSSGDNNDSSSLKASSPWQLSRLIQLLLAAMPCLEAKDHTTMWEQLLAELPEFSLQIQDDYSHEQACRCLSALVNRMPKGDWLDNSVNSWCSKLTLILNQQQPTDFDLQCRALNLLTWLTKATVVRGHALSADLTSQLTSLLSESTLGPKAAESFRIILTVFPDVLSVEVHANLIPTFQQRFFIQNLPQLLKGFQDAHSDVKENYLLAVAGMLTNVPQQVFVTELPQLMLVLTSSLKGSNPSLHIQALTTLAAGVKQTPQLLVSYLSDILPDCLKLATQGANMHVRILALQCVGDMVHLPPASLQPHKSSVIKQLKGAIDDHKRLVRKEAVLARSAWYLL